MVTLETAIEITLRCSIHRIPEPTRQVSWLVSSFIIKNLLE